MRLIESVIQAPRTRIGQDKTGKSYKLPGPGVRSGEIESCRLRYVIDLAASRCCCDLIRTQPDLFEPNNPALRMPAEQFWMEWIEEPDPSKPANTCVNTRMAVLVEASASGRRGVLTRFYEDGAGNVDMAPGTLSFDLDHFMMTPRKSASSYALRHATLPHVSALLRHATLHIDPAWTAAFARCTRAEYRNFVATTAAGMWFVLPFTLAFSALLKSETSLAERRIGLPPRHAGNAQYGRAPLDEHIEISLRLGARQEAASRAGASLPRGAPRLHLVRGHLVNRAGKTFWRAAHSRGSNSPPIVSKTVKVSAEERKGVSV